MLRTIAIALILVLSVGVMLPFSNSAHGVRQSVQVSKKRHHRYRSRAWWRRYRARLRQKRAAAAQLAAHRNQMLSLPKNIPVGDLSAAGGPSVPVLPETSLGVSSLPAPPAMESAPAPPSPGRSSYGPTHSPTVVRPAADYDAARVYPAGRATEASSDPRNGQQQRRYDRCCNQSVYKTRKETE